MIAWIKYMLRRIRWLAGYPGYDFGDPGLDRRSKDMIKARYDEMDPQPSANTLKARFPQRKEMLARMLLRASARQRGSRRFSPLNCRGTGAKGSAKLSLVGLISLVSFYLKAN